MEKEQRSRLQKATQDARRLLEEEFRSQLLETYDINVAAGRWNEESGAHLQGEQRLIREKLVAWIEHKEAQISDRKEALLLAQREMAFTALNRFVALKLMEARELVRPCVSGGLESEGFQEFTAVAQGLLADQEAAYRLYLETIFEDVGQEVRVLFDPRDPASALWPRRTALLELLAILNRPELAELWAEDETIGWVYQYFNGDAERKAMREESSAPRNSRELAVRNQFFTPRYVVEFLTDNTLCRLWYEMTCGETALRDHCRYLVRRPTEIFLKPGESAPENAAGSEAQTGGNPSQEELLRQPVYIPHRPLKDPREIRLLDPACGSMHFGLYAFDLFSVIYDEAWEIAHGPDEAAKSAETFAPFVTFAATFADKVAFLREVPRLIVERNIHGIDIDPRAAQIAGLSLWLRAQRAWHQAGVKPSDRPHIIRSNLVCAEPMPGEKELLREFVEQQFPACERPAFAFLLEKIFDRMTLAGEAGSLLRIEEEIRSGIGEARALAKSQSAPRQTRLFPGDEILERTEFDLNGLNDEQFWQRAEQRIYDALEAYAEQAESGGGFQRRLFADDTAQGFAFIDLCRKRYDVAVMNPPFGDASLPSKSYIDETYGDTKGDVYKAFVECFNDRLVPAGYLGIISSRTGFFLRQSEDWRTRVVLRLFRPLALADLGMGVLDAMVEVAAYVLRNLSDEETRDLTLSLVPVLEQVERDRQDRFSLPKWQSARGGLKRHQAVAELEHLEANGFIQRSPGDIVRYSPLWQVAKKATAPAKPLYPPLMCVRALGDTDKGAAILDAISQPHAGKLTICDPGSFREIPGAPFAYWASPTVRGLFNKFPQFESDERSVRVGLQTSDNCRFLRSWWEGPPTDARQAWVPFAKGGSTQNFFADVVSAVNWQDNGAELKAWTETLPGSTHWSRSIRSPDFYFRPGITWPLRASRFSPQAMPLGCIFSIRGQVAFASEEELPWMLSLMASAAFDAIYKTMLGRFGFPEFVVGVLQQLPFPEVGAPEKARLAALAADAWRHKRTRHIASEVSQYFLAAGTFQLTGVTLSKRAAGWAARVRISQDTVAAIQSEIDDLAFRLYGLDATDRAALTFTLAIEATGTSEAEAGEDDAEETDTADTPSLVADLLAYTLGTAFGRWDIRYATGERAAPELPDPFAPLPVCPPGMLRGDDGLPLSPEAGRRLRAAGDYPLDVAWDGILVDDTEHPLDLEHRVHAALAVLWADRSEAIQHEACELLGVSKLRDWFRRPANFFADHLSRYSKSRRQAPIYWQLSLGSCSYSVWIYYHRFTPDMLYRVLRDFVEPRLQEAERELFDLETQGVLYGAAAERLQTTQALLPELKLLKAELDLVSPLWNPNLNDGVVINHAILWRITPYTPWQKKCKECWDKLVAGDYDWAHLAFHLWPDRVIPKCATDRSLAIAHGLEERLWQETKNGNWVPRQVSKAELRALITEHTKPAVQNALERFLAAPPPVAAARTRSPKAARSSSTGTTRRPRGTATVVDAEASRQTLLVLTAAPAEGLGRNAIADLLAVEAASLTAVIKQLKEEGQIEQLGAARGAKYRLTEQGRAAVACQAGEVD
ncbi:MAG: hypothetical protein DCF23_04800 [Cyanobium sp.]|nr:MAG: hypothetical protein DCF23_04800 [Cyanobium sp.]